MLWTNKTYISYGMPKWIAFAKQLTLLPTLLVAREHYSLLIVPRYPTLSESLWRVWTARYKKPYDTSIRRYHYAYTKLTSGSTTTASNSAARKGHPLTYVDKALFPIIFQCILNVFVNYPHYWSWRWNIVRIHVS